MKKTSWVGALHWFVPLLFAGIGLGAAQAAAEGGDLSQEQIDAFKPMMCGTCLTIGETRIFRGGNSPSVVPTEGEISAGMYLLAKGDVTPKTRHVCMGRRYAPKKDQPIWLLPTNDMPILVYAPERGGQVPSYTEHPAKFDGVCLGTLVPIEEFLKLAVGSLFIDQLQKTETLLNSESLNQVVKNNLSAAFETTRAQMTAQITADVVAQLKKDRPADAVTTPSTPVDGPLACQIVLACTGASKPTASCCSCLVAGNGYREGTCEVKDNRWYLKKP